MARLLRTLLFFVVACTPSSSAGRSVQVDPSGNQQEPPQSCNVTFVNSRRTGECGLYWSGSRPNSGPRIFYGPIAPKGGSRIIEGFPGQVFVLVESGTYERLVEFTIAEGEQQRFELTENEAPQKSNGSDSHARAAACRSLASCEQCMERSGCGWSVVRKSCFLAHPIATMSDTLECSVQLPDPGSNSVDAWLNQANALVMGATNQPLALRKAFRILEQAAKAAKQADARRQKKVKGALMELSAKLEAVFDEQDAKELLEKSRHAPLAEIHPQMPMVHRRTLDQAQTYIAQGKPVVITNAAATIPVANTWTLEYLHRTIFRGTTSKPKFNVAADHHSRCCRYFEPQQNAKQAGYPYPFAPSTHLYRDHFDGFVKTVRKAARSSASSNSNNRLLHYLHEIVMNAQGEAVVAGGAAPPQLVADIEAVKATLQPIAEDQPFFGGFASAKLWMGQRGIIMPLHYDSTDNLYVMGWGRKRAIIGPPGQLDALYRYPNAHPLVGSSQVNLSAPDLLKFPNFQQAKLQEVIVGPGDILYLPGWWWHQFEQPFEDTAALNLWSRDRDQAPDPSLRDKRIREHALFDHLERSLEQIFGNQTGIMLEALANQKYEELQPQFARAHTALEAAAQSWREFAMRMPGGHSKALQSAAQLVNEYLETQKEVMREAWTEWQPGIEWDLSQAAKLPRDLRERCESAPESSPFLSHCSS